MKVGVATAALAQLPEWFRRSSLMRHLPRAGVIGFGALLAISLFLHAGAWSRYETRESFARWPGGGKALYVGLGRDLALSPLLGSGGDSPFNLAQSDLQAWIGDAGLGPAHAPIERIVESGGGAFSHLWRDRLIFSLPGQAQGLPAGPLRVRYQVHVHEFVEAFLWAAWIVALLAWLARWPVDRPRGAARGALAAAGVGLIAAAALALTALAALLGVALAAVSGDPYPALSEASSGFLQAIAENATWMLQAILLVCACAVVLARNRISGGLLSIGRVRIEAPRFLYWAAALSIVALDNLVFASTLVMPMAEPDSLSYLDWSIVRTFGYPALLKAFHWLFGSWALLPLVQLNLVLAGALVMSASLTRATGTWLAGFAFLWMMQSLGVTLASSNEILTETPFAAFMMLHLGFLVLYLFDGRGGHAVLSGAALAVAVAIKSVGVALLPAVVLLMLRAAKPLRGRLMAFVFLPALLAFLLPSLYNYHRMGIFETSALGGIALAGHVGWAIHPYPDRPYAAEAARIEQRLRPVLAQRPADFRSRWDYVNYTANEYNPMLWGSIVPEVESFYKSTDCAHRGERLDWCLVKIDKVLMSLSKDAISHNPMAYANHVLNHFGANWAMVFRSQEVSLGAAEAAANLRATYANPAYGPLLPAPLPAADDGDALRRNQRQWLSASIRSFEGAVMLIPTPFAAGLGLIGAAWILFPRRLDPAELAFSYAALSVNAYLLAHALAQPALARYATAIQGPVLAMSILGVAALVRLRRGSVRAAAGQPAPAVS